MKQGDVYGLTFAGAGSGPRGRRPALVVQHDRYNRTAIATTIVAAITSNLRLAAMPGNVRLRKGEAKLPRPCVVIVSQLLTADRDRLGKPIGTVSHGRLREVLRGLALALGTDSLDA